MPARIRANGARLAQHSAERASGSWTPQALTFDGARRRVAKLTQEFIEESYQRAIRIEDLRRVTGVGVRTLQRCFREYFGVTITGYIKTVRLDRAHRALVARRDLQDSVTAVALEHGFTHLGRFSVEYRNRFGELPRETLRSEPAAFDQPDET